MLRRALEEAAAGAGARLAFSDGAGGRDGARPREERPEDGHARLHGPGGHEDLGHEEPVVLEVLPHHGHAGDETLREHLLGRAPLGESIDVSAWTPGAFPS
jgi:hypothetical protein